MEGVVLLLFLSMLLLEVLDAVILLRSNANGGALAQTHLRLYISIADRNERIGRINTNSDQIV